jgi:RND family efflux transporter MFP subunit
MPLRRQLAITSVLAALLAAGWIWLTGSQDAAESGEAKGKLAAATLVLVEALELAEDRVVVRAVGTGEALKSAAIHPSVAGEVVEVGFAADQRVEAGTVLVRLDDKHQQLAVRLIEVALGEAKREVARLERLAPSGHVTQVRLETAKAALKSASLRLAQAKADLADRTVTAPFDGVIGMTEIDTGDRVTDDTMIATLDDRSVILVDFTLPEDYAGRIRVGDPVTVRPWTMPEREIEGRVSATGSRIEPTSRSLRVRAQIPNPDDTIRPGTSFEVELAFTGRSYPRVREVAVLWSRDGAYLWRANGGKAEKVFVELVRRDRGRVLVAGRLRAGDLIVVEGVQGLRAGQALDPVPFGPGEAAGTKLGEVGGRL